MLHAIISLDDVDLIKILSNEKNSDLDRSSLKFNKNKVEITAKDVVAFKATVNSVIKLIEAYNNTSKAIK